jgi:diacylglycerol kinase family enzyme
MECLMGIIENSSSLGQLKISVINQSLFLKHLLKHSLSDLRLLKSTPHINEESLLQLESKKIVVTPVYHDEIALYADGEVLGKLPATCEVLSKKINYII